MLNKIKIIVDAFVALTFTVTVTINETLKWLSSVPS